MIVARQTTLFITHLKSKTNRSETFDATEQLCDLNKNNGDGQTDDKKRSRTIFRTSYGSSSNSGGSGTKSTESFNSGTRGRAKSKFLLGQLCQQCR